MSPISDNDVSLTSSLGRTPCPKCQGETIFDIAAKAIVRDTTSVFIPLICQQCGHKWGIELQKLATNPIDILHNKAFDKLSIDQPLRKGAESTTSHPQVQVATSGQAIFKYSPVVVIPRPIFWGLLVLIILLFGLGGWLFSELRQKRIEDALTIEKEVALLMIQATAEAEAHQTATQQMLAHNATATAEARIEAGIAATAVAERKATSTAESVATLGAEAIFTAERVKTATAERVATVNALATATAEYKGTATAERVATANVKATTTAQWQATQTAKASATLTPTPTPTPIPKLNLLILGCDTGLDVTRGMGEVKNAWVTVQNVGDGDATDIQIILSANDEGEQHPDKSISFAHLPAGYQITYKLTVDTSLGTGSVIKAVVTSSQGISAEGTKSSCRVLDENAKKLIEQAGVLGEFILMSRLPKTFSLR